ncbi:hypothetical protein OJF2_73200 [Aquisphaera giovannonii]|uniref:Uncharacterized protein n=1 Tax=Aquisphaera giovannonii TaxID=406548 RepID=A0A5B9WER7_9BACT|nr:hypothetical protein [Aquisphaera giovannonii]QEH38714.1 hypothetical protein OJF2_73200 [Aquisphaera giovannonii]
MKSKEEAILDRIKRLEEAIAKGREYLETGAHADWHGFRPLFVRKMKDGKMTPPHRDWVKNVLLLRRERALRETERLLESCTMRESRRGRIRIKLGHDDLA